MRSEPAMLRAARWLRDARGFSVIPIQPGTKRPAVKWTEFQHRRATDDELRGWFGNGHTHGLAVVTGPISGVVVVDDDSPAAKAWADAHLPPSAMATRTLRGTHRFYRHPGGIVRNAVRIETGDPAAQLDVRGDGGYVLVPPTSHPSGGRYTRLGPWPPVEHLPVFNPSWLAPARPEPAASSSPAEAPDEVLRRARAYVESVPPAIQGQGGDAHTFRLCAKLTRGFDLSDADTLDLLSTWNARCVPPWSDAELRAKVASARRNGSETVGARAAQPRPAGAATPASVAVATTPAPEDRLTEAGAAERFARLHGGDVRFDHRRNRWLLWQAHRWVPDADAAVTRLALDFARAWQREAADLPDRERREATFKAALRLERREAVVSMLRFAADLRPIADAGDGWDRDPLLLGAPNGVVDLRTGALRPGRREDRITLAVSVPYDPHATSPLWTRTLREVLVADALVAFVQVAVGYSATGDTRRDCWFLAHGDGRNGKGTLLHPIRRALGDYAMELPAAIFDRRRDAAPYDLAALPGKRLVMSSESGDTIRMHHDRIKQISGGDPIRAANKYERSFEFDPVCKLWLACNRMPDVTDDTPAFWARVLTVPFAVSFVGREDRALRPALEHEPAHQAAILAWIVVGASRYLRDGLDAPAAVTQATSRYREDSDPLSAFAADALDEDPEAEVRAADLYAHWQRWASAQGLTPRDPEWLTATAFGRRASARLRWAARKTGKVFLGLVRRPL